MHDIDGFQVIENKIDRKIDTPVIIMTGRSSTDTAVKAMRMGAIDYLKKPFETREMFSSVKNILNQRKLEKKHKAAESQSAQLRKLESLGRMAGSIAHHFNNQLSVVMGNLEIALDDLPVDAGCRKNLFQAMMAAHKATSVSRQMLLYLGHTPGRYRPTDLSESCRKTLALFQTAIPRGMILTVDFPDSGPIIQADPIQIQQVLTHLITNAWVSRRFPMKTYLAGASPSTGSPGILPMPAWRYQTPAAGYRPKTSKNCLILFLPQNSWAAGWACLW
jgi:FixJ family two-component response regulator